VHGPSKTKKWLKIKLSRGTEAGTETATPPWECWRPAGELRVTLKSRTRQRDAGAPRICARPI